MSVVDDYLAELEPGERALLGHYRDLVYAAYPEVTEKVSYGMPTFVLEGHALGGFLRHTKHLSWYPHSGTTLATLGEAIGARKRTKSALHFTVADPLPDETLHALLDARRAEWD